MAARDVVVRERAQIAALYEVLDHDTPKLCLVVPPKALAVVLYHDVATVSAHSVL